MLCNELNDLFVSTLSLVVSKLIPNSLAWSAKWSNTLKMTTTVSSTWSPPPDTPLSVLEARGADAAVHGIMFAGLPLALSRPQPLQQQAPLPPTLLIQGNASPPCEVVLEWLKHQPLRCHQLKLEVVSSARHVELYVEGVRRSLLGENEQGEVYLGTFRGTKAAGSTPTGAPQFFSVSEEFFQRDAKTNILKEMHKLRVKFVSLTDDKSTLHLQELKCAFVPLQTASVSTSAVPPLAFAMPASSPVRCVVTSSMHSAMQTARS